MKKERDVFTFCMCSYFVKMLHKLRQHREKDSLEIRQYGADF